MRLQSMKKNLDLRLRRPRKFHDSSATSFLSCQGFDKKQSWAGSNSPLEQESARTDQILLTQRD